MCFIYYSTRDDLKFKNNYNNNYISNNVIFETNFRIDTLAPHNVHVGPRRTLAVHASSAVGYSIIAILLSLFFFSSYNGRADKRYVIVNVYIYNNI